MKIHQDALLFKRGEHPVLLQTELEFSTRCVNYSTGRRKTPCPPRREGISRLKRK